MSIRKWLGGGFGAATLAMASMLAARRFRRRLAVSTGTFRNGMGYARRGSGPKSLLWIGGPSVGRPPVCTSR